MKRFWRSMAAILALLSCGLLNLPACTTLIVTKGASADGCMYVAHCDDNVGNDQSIVAVPARRFGANATRNVYPSTGAVGPLPQFNVTQAHRLVSKDFGPGYDVPGEPLSIPIGTIPQVRSTYAYLTGSYGILNEKGLMFGECTDVANINIPPEKGKLIFYSTELSNIALERCTNPRDAIKLMGQLIDTYGYYGTAETLPVADKDEAWVFEMAPSPDGKGGLWVAQRVPDGQVFAAANELRIREISVDNPDQIVTQHTIDVIKASNWVKYGADGKTVDWAPSVSPPENPTYICTRRVWRIFSLCAPSLNLPAKLEGPFSRTYPFTVKPDKKVSLNDIMAIYRDHYEGTEFDLTKGVGAGPFGLPYRYGGARPEEFARYKTTDGNAPGAWERPIGASYTGYATICQYGSQMPAPVVWIALCTVAESVFIPHTATMIPPSYEKQSCLVFDPEKAWWICNDVVEITASKYCYIIKDVKAKSSSIEEAEQKLVASFNGSRDSRKFAKALYDNSLSTLKDWNKLYGQLRIRYAQGSVGPRYIGYPADWLLTTEYMNRSPSQY